MAEEGAYVRALCLVTGLDSFTSAQKKVLLAHINEDMDYLHCCVLWDRNMAFREALASVGISPDILEKHEVIITKSKDLLYSRNYKASAPKHV